MVAVMEALTSDSTVYEIAVRSNTSIEKTKVQRSLFQFYDSYT